ncbi:MAG: hypothetical protein PHX47_02665, partial [Candidatus ainarchaeum sp.]|nr:hypothetical protein [Candidatus ainarchaeum sp.]
MGGEDNFSGFKVIKRIPLSKSISKDSSSLKNNIIKHNTEKNKSFKKLEKFDVVLPEDKKINSSLLKDYSGIKKIDLKVDISDIEEKYKDFNPFRKKEVSLENEKKKVDLSNSYLKENSLEKVNSVDKINDVKETKPDISKKASFEKDSLKS